MESLLVDMRHGRAGDIKDVVAVGDPERLPTDKTKVTKRFTWFWISITEVGTFILVIAFMVILDIVIIV